MTQPERFRSEEIRGCRRKQASHGQGKQRAGDEDVTGGLSKSGVRSQAELTLRNYEGLCIDGERLDGLRAVINVLLETSCFHNQGTSPGEERR